MNLLDRFQQTISTEETICKKLAKVVKAKYHPRWISDVRSMLKRGEANESEIDLVLNWLQGNHGLPFVPVVYSAKTFRQKFEKLLKLSNANRKRKITSEAREVLDRAFLILEPGEADDAIRFVQDCLDGYREYISVLNTWKPKERYRAIMTKTKLSALPPVDFVSDWIGGAWDMMKRKGVDTSGDLSGWVCGIKNKRFQSKQRKIVEEFTGNGIDWDRMLR